MRDKATWHHLIKINVFCFIFLLQIYTKIEKILKCNIYKSCQNYKDRHLLLFRPRAKDDDELPIVCRPLIVTMTGMTAVY